MQLLRVHQWVKNGLLFIPALTAHRLFDWELFKVNLLAFTSFSLVASAVYLINDLLDISSDRLHPRKKNRPFASGAVPTQVGYILAPILIGVGFLLSMKVGESFLYTLSIYLGITFLYSLYVKRLLLWDVIFLAGLYTVRIFAGSAATDIPVSKWLLAFSLFLFFSLALVKRVSELQVLKKQQVQLTPGRGYQIIDEEILSNLGASSACLSILVFALYLSSPEVVNFYRYPERLWLSCPLILYWVSRIWVIGSRGQLHDDPIVFALKDRVSYLIFALTAAVLFIAT